ncbi:BREX system Lon protease-like protein BrxL [Desulfamplus magnetovallimortis]|uniref:BREX system Lon protease-like protein BrxL n=1 Tax=Desulfamplus magnetovallimortis TaxID=1246637 RepID=UPI0009BB4EE8
MKDHINAQGDLRDTRVVERLACGYLKLLFPNIESVSMEQFNEYCLQPAIELRSNIRRQMAYLDPEFSPYIAKISLL